MGSLALYSLLNINEVPVFWLGQTDRSEAQRHGAGMRSLKSPAVPWASQLTLLWTGISQPPDNCYSIVRDGLTHLQKTERQRDGRTDISYYRCLSSPGFWHVRPLLQGQVRMEPGLLQGF